ncbi:DUF4017 family protein [Ectobacillus panaciterrae]|uniref:DUF4017 family protein n=1 Tax=Ectobacillus panaciterrae TaxID=363872 RepID=UPI000404D0AD|nr:DUF4017 family protein [Ectobacillus panaciterrae]
MRNVVIPLVAYLIVCIGTVLSTASQGYNTIGWKLFVGQIYAIPTLIIVALVTFYSSKKSVRK